MKDVLAIATNLCYLVGSILFAIGTIINLYRQFRS